QWNKIGVKAHHGFTVPLFSIHTAQSSGIGEYTDLIPLIDWCKSVQFDLIQLLPLNDTGLGTSPYSSISAFALNPLYIGLHALPFLDRFPVLEEELKALPKLTSQTRVDYATVRENKERFLSHYIKEAKELLLSSHSYRTFEQNSFWLKGYAAFKTVKQKFQWSNWEAWPTEYLHPTPALIEKISGEHSEEIESHCLLQFLCAQQLHEAKEHANKVDVLIMGDIPILIDRDSADVWQHPEIFDMNFSAGSPPDFYSQEGQDWGMPIYNWDEMGSNHYRWWKDRINLADRYYHLYRLDHILGFYRFWSIQKGKTAKEGIHIPQDRSKWIDQGQRLLLTLMEESLMLPIAEDLGDISDEVRASLNALGISGTRVMRWERKWKEDSSFIPIDHYQPHSMTTVSTHDSETLQQWWRNYPLEAQILAQSKGWSYQSHLSRENHQALLWDSHHTSSLFHINLLQEYLSLLPGLSWGVDEERINIPGVISDNNWTFRLRPNIETLAANQTLRHLMQNLVI
ncbi:MAG: 4-alpha-glucanotransferase, partial [Parachlamydia sp.]|nr:4-alpha-glucanotransferase [Parachlamydia sp.]